MESKEHAAVAYLVETVGNELVAEAVEETFRRNLWCSYLQFHSVGGLLKKNLFVVQWEVEIETARMEVGTGTAVALVALVVEVAVPAAVVVLKKTVLAAVLVAAGPLFPLLLTLEVVGAAPLVSSFFLFLVSGLLVLVLAPRFVLVHVFVPPLFVGVDVYDPFVVLFQAFALAVHG